MARPRYSAAKRAREIRKQEERARKLARKHNRAAARSANAASQIVPDEAPASPPPGADQADILPRSPDSR
jgi:hypothetical protein